MEKSFGTKKLLKEKTTRVTRQFLDASAGKGRGSEVACHGPSAMHYSLHFFSADRASVSEQRVASIDRYLISSAQAGGREGITPTPGEEEGERGPRQHVDSIAPLGILWRDPLRSVLITLPIFFSDLRVQPRVGRLPKRPSVQETRGIHPFPVAVLKNKALSDVIRGGHRGKSRSQKKRARASGVSGSWVE